MSYASSPIADLVAPYLDRVKGGQRNLNARCPFHDDHSPSFSINVQTGAWICGGCKLKGGLTTFFQLLGMKRHQVDNLIEPVRYLLDQQRVRDRRKTRNRFKRSDPFKGERALRESILGVFDFAPLDLIDKGFDPKVLRAFDIGYDRNRDRIIYPIRDLYGSLVGVSGRSVIGEKPRYKVYRGGFLDQEGTKHAGDFGEEFDELYPGYEINPKNYLWNAHQVCPAVISNAEDEPIFIVEGYKAALWMIQNGFTNTVATMGSSMSRVQYDIIARLGGPKVMFYDNDRAGIEGTLRVGKWLSKIGQVECVVPFPWAKQPDDLNGNGLRTVVNNRVRFQKWKREVQMVVDVLEVT